MDAIDTTPGLHGAAKWGAAGVTGFQQVPDALLMKQQALGLSGLDLLVLLNITSFWWRGDQPPYLRPKLIAGRLGVSVRSVQRVVKKLERMRLIRRERFEDAEGKSRPGVFLDGLVTQLEKLVATDKVLADRLRKATPYRADAKVIPAGGAMSL